MAGRVELGAPMRLCTCVLSLSACKFLTELALDDLIIAAALYSLSTGDSLGVKHQGLDHVDEASQYVAHVNCNVCQMLYGA